MMHFSVHASSKAMFTISLAVHHGNIGDTIDRLRSMIGSEATFVVLEKK